jgi:O-antigen/teichoic acid export membrane protein
MSRRSDAWALVLLLLSALGSAGVAFAVQAALARTLHADQYGHFASALATLTIVAPAVGFGLPSVWLKLYGTEGWATARWMRASARFVCISSIACVAATLAWSFFGVRDIETTRLIVWMLPALLSPGAIELASARFQLEERFGLVAAWQAFQHCARLGVVLVCYLLNARVDNVAIGFGCIGIIVIAGGVWTLSPLFKGRLRLAGHGERPAPGSATQAAALPGVGELWHGAYPFGVTSLLYFGYVQSGLLLVAYLTSPGRVALYSVALTILAAIYLFPTVLFQKLLMPRLHRWAAANDARLHQSYRTGNRCMLAAGLVAGLATALLAPVLIPAVFGEHYREAVPLVVIMSACAPLRFVTTSASSIMTSRNQIQILNGCMGAAFVCSIVAAMLLVPRFDLKGAAGAFVFGEAVWTVLIVIAATRIMQNRQRRRDAACVQAAGRRPGERVARTVESETT